MEKLEEIKAIVQKVVLEGNHGPFAVATSENIDGSITFSLEPTVWQKDEWPEQGMIVILSKLRKKRAGWRAKKGWFLKPSDEQTETSNQEGRKEMKKVHEEYFKLIEGGLGCGLLPVEGDYVRMKRHTHSHHIKRDYDGDTLQDIQKWAEEVKDEKQSHRKKLSLYDICCPACHKKLLSGIDKILEVIPNLEIKLNFNYNPGSIGEKIEIRKSKILKLL